MVLGLKSNNLKKREMENMTDEFYLQLQKRMDGIPDPVINNPLLDEDPGSSPIPEFCQVQSNLNQNCAESDCGSKIFPSIVGGKTATPGSHPWIASIMENSNHICGGALVSNKHVLTAAHCVLQGNDYTVRLGEHDQDDKTDPNQIDMPVKEVVTHQDYITTRTGIKNDIALVVLETPVALTSRIAPICLPYGDLREYDFANSEATASGWGKLTSGGEFASILQEVNLKIVPQNDCSKVWRSIKDQHICARAPGKDSCDGDSGGPLTVFDSKTGLNYLIGLVSFGLRNRCADKKFPGVYTRITSYMDWIEENVRNTL
ncbi:venom protease-like isoform X2 [Artemia franciscana]|uniref:venom protease-like isoform X2 n=1 Tax=Artemia franciscana TaxID=6661 RepID=UPI0032DB03FD